MSEELNKQLLSQLECPVCLETCLPPIYMCRNGHGVCAKCRSQLKECSTCRVPGMPIARSVQLEKIAALLKHPCENQAFGCKLDFNMDEMVKHLPKCKHAFKCYLCTDWKGSSRDLQDHVTFRHDSKFIDLPLCGYILTRVNSPFKKELQDKTYFHAFLFNDDIFWLESKYTSSTRNFSRTMRIASSDPEKASRYSYSIEYESIDKNYKCTVFHRNNILKEGAVATGDMDVVLPVSVIRDNVSGLMDCSLKMIKNSEVFEPWDQD